MGLGIYNYIGLRIDVPQPHPEKKKPRGCEIFNLSEYSNIPFQGRAPRDAMTSSGLALKPKVGVGLGSQPAGPAFFLPHSGGENM